jgi:hypothetical protein
MELDERSHYLIAFDEAIATAEREGLSIVRGTPDTLLLDLDTDQHKAQFAAMLPLIRSTVGVAKVVDEWVSRSGVGRHVVIKLDRQLTATERILLQMALGSDPEHELLSLTTGIWEGNTEPTVLFRPACPAPVKEEK